MMKERSRVFRWSFLAAVAALGLLAAGGAAHDDFVTIDIPGSADVEAYGIDNHGNVTGLYVDADGNYRGFVAENGVTTTVDAPTSNPSLSQTQLYNINNKEQVGAYYVDDNGVSQGAVYDLGAQTWTTLPLINVPAYYTGAGGVNAAGVVTGNWTPDPSGNTGEQGWTFDPKTNPIPSSTFQVSTRSTISARLFTTSTTLGSSSASSATPAVAFTASPRTAPSTGRSTCPGRSIPSSTGSTIRATSPVATEWATRVMDSCSGTTGN